MEITMKKIFNIILSTIISTSLILNMFADTDQNHTSDEDVKQLISSIDELSYSEQISIIEKSDLSDIVKNEVLEQIKYLEYISDNREVIEAKLDNSFQLTVQFHSQINDDYCGPATLQQTYEYLYYLKHKWYYAPSQETIYKEISNDDSTDIERYKMVDYLNNSDLNRTFRSQWFSSSTTQDVFDTCIKNNISSKTPVVMHIIVSSSQSGRKSYDDTSKWLFKTSGHFLNVSGYDFSSSNSKRYCVVDPYADRYPNFSSGIYYVTNTITKASTDYAIINADI